MKDIEELALIVERQTSLIDDLINRLIAAEARIDDISEKMSHLEKDCKEWSWLWQRIDDRSQESTDKVDELKIEFIKLKQDADKAVDLANKSLYYIPKTAEQVEEIIYNKVSSELSRRLRLIVNQEIINHKHKLAKLLVK